MSLGSIMRSTWKALPHSVRDTALLTYAKNIARKRLPKEISSYGGRKVFPAVLTSLNELDEALAYAEYLEPLDQDAFFQFVRSISLKPPFPESSSDPFSVEYSQQQFQIYKWLRGRDYEVQQEALSIYVKETIQTPYPYVTRSSQIVGNQLMAIGQLIKTVDARQGLRVLEMGPGHGNVTLQLSQLGCEVTAVDISKDFLKVVSARLRKVGKKADLLNCDFLDIKNVNKKFDVVIFNACFHHCSDHSRLIKNLVDLVEPGGKIFFCNEPISDGQPIPWGLRLDGESIFHIRLHGWLELGFQEQYFRTMMERNGWSTEKIPSIIGGDPIFVCTKHGGQ